ncbi:MAG: hypothetical protein K8S23_05845 [Candidatus Cloacimonetes bacterium]|nr:hypothetical protein [Candidatus Cloacimonadota bacterium]
MNNALITYQVEKSTIIYHLLICFYLVFLFVFTAIIFIKTGDFYFNIIIGVVFLSLVSVIFLILITPFKIFIDNDLISFKSMFSKKTYHIQEMINIKTSISGSTMHFHFKIKDKKKRISIPNRITNLYKLLSDLKMENKDIEFYGC